MSTGSNMLAGADRENMRAVMDRLIPPVDDLPGAGAMGLLEDVERMAIQYDRYARSLRKFLDAVSHVSPGTGHSFVALDPDRQDEAIRAIEASAAEEFANVLEVIYLAYYSRPEVHARIGWRTGPLQPRGFALPPFNESVLDAVRKRRPFWRRTTDT
jgi:hypothetical protein